MVLISGSDSQIGSVSEKDQRRKVMDNLLGGGAEES
jgi:hypothetical protein